MQKEGRMKVRLATVMSLSGVLAAGSAAALVNTQILSHSGNFGASNTVQLAQSTSPDATSPLVTLPSEATLPGNTLQRDTTIAPGVLPRASTQAAYQIGDAGMVTLDTSGDVLVVVAVAPSSNWTLLEVKSEDPTNIEVKLQSRTNLVEFHATLLFGIVGTSIETKSRVPTNGGVGTATVTNSTAPAVAVTATTRPATTPPTATPPTATATSPTATSPTATTVTRTTETHTTETHGTGESPDGEPPEDD